MIGIASLAGLAALASSAAATPTNLWVEDCTFADTYAFNKAECELTLSNRGDKPIRVVEVQPLRVDDRARVGALVVGPHAKAYLPLVIDTGNDIGGSRHVFHIRTDEPGHEERTAAARGFVLTVIERGRPSVDFGVVGVKGGAATKSVDLESRDVKDLRITKIISAPAYLGSKLDADGRKLSVTVGENAPWGFHTDYVRLATNSLAQSEVWVGVQFDYHGRVVAGSNPLNMGLMQTGNHNEQLIRLTDTDGKDFTVGHIDIQGFAGATSIASCSPEGEAGCKLLKLIVSDKQTLGTLKGSIDVGFPDHHKVMRIAVWGLLVDKNAKIEKLDSEKLLQERADSGKSSRVPSDPSVDIKSALNSAISSASQTAPLGNGPLLKWTVANEALIHGYQVFRGNSELGEFLLQSKQLIRASNQQATSSTYQWRDDEAASGTTYWYYIGIVYNDGHKQQLTGPQKVVAK